MISLSDLSIVNNVYISSNVLNYATLKYIIKNLFNNVKHWIFNAVQIYTVTSAFESQVETLKPMPGPETESQSLTWRARMFTSNPQLSHIQVMSPSWDQQTL